MNFFNSLIQDTLALTDNLPQKKHSFDKNGGWNDLGCNQVILQRDSAYEISGTGFNLVTSERVDDEIIVCGEDLSEIKGDRPFVRISVIEIDSEDDEQKAYNLIRKIEYVKYHYFPEGYMIRTSTNAQKEAVRVAKSAIRKGIDFQKVGNLLINKYKEIPQVKGVKVFFVTSNEADYFRFSEIAEKGNTITKALNHIMSTVNFDCDSCNLKPVCDEVEGMRELHFRNGMAMKGVRDE